MSEHEQERLEQVQDGPEDTLSQAEGSAAGERGGWGECAGCEGRNGHEQGGGNAGSGENSKGEAREQDQGQKSGEREGKKGGGKSKGRFMVVRYGRMKHVGHFRHDERHIPPGVKYVVVQTERGMELGEIVAPYVHKRGAWTADPEKMERYYEESGGKDYPLSQHGRVVRFATDQDLNEQRHLDMEAKEERKRCEELIAKHNLPMDLVEVEHLFGGDRIIYYFMAEGRVDFRELVRELAHEYQTRIEMRQIGARDEARLVADFETCGRECCCKNFLKVLRPVNMRMAKVQKATLDPSKISGRCGRLKCCLRYEDAVYHDLSRRLPKINSRVRVDEGVGTVLETQVLTQLVRLRLESGRQIAVNVEDIRERNVKEGDRDRAEKRPPRRQEQEAVKEEQKAEADKGQENQGQGQKEGGQKKKRRRRRKKSKDGSSSSNTS